MQKLKVCETDQGNRVSIGQAVCILCENELANNYTSVTGKVWKNSTLK